MRKVKAEITKQLLIALHEANLASCTDVDYANDLDDICNSQDNLFGYIAEALKLLDEDVYWNYCDTGDIPD